MRNTGLKILYLCSMRYMPKSKRVPASLKKLPVPKRVEEFDEHLIGPDVKRRLLDDQHGKCIYCECLLTGDYGHIEHFRPKGGYTIPGDRTLHKPGYYWLAYQWKNLLLSCSKCNTSFKQNHFPLADESVRDIQHRRTRQEEPLLINPSQEDPRRFIEFQEYLLVPREKKGSRVNRKGATTIEVLRLNERPELVKRRRRVWEAHHHWEHIQVAGMLLMLRQPGNAGSFLLRTANHELHAMEAPDAEFSGMFL